MYILSIYLTGLVLFSLPVLALETEEQKLSIINTNNTRTAEASVFAVNCGGGSYTSTDGTQYASDTAFSGGSTYTTEESISGTTDDILYQSERYGNFKYSVTVPDGIYLVTLHFAETYHRAAGLRTGCGDDTTASSARVEHEIAR